MIKKLEGLEPAGARSDRIGSDLCLVRLPPSRQLWVHGVAQFVERT